MSERGTVLRPAIGGGGGGGSGIKTYATKQDADAAVGVPGAYKVPGAICYVTELDRYYHLLANHTWQAWSFLE